MQETLIKFIEACDRLNSACKKIDSTMKELFPEEGFMQKEKDNGTQTAIRTIVDKIESQESAIAELIKRQENEEQINLALREALKIEREKREQLERDYSQILSINRDISAREPHLRNLLSLREVIITKQQIAIGLLIVGFLAFYGISGLYFGIIAPPAWLM